MSKFVPVAVCSGVPSRAVRRRGDVRDPGLSSEPLAGEGALEVLELFCRGAGRKGPSGEIPGLRYPAVVPSGHSLFPAGSRGSLNVAAALALSFCALLVNVASATLVCING